MDVYLHIERLILDGLPITHHQGPALQASVEAELTRLLVEQGLATNLQTSGALRTVQTNAIQFAPGSRPEQMGTQIAQSVYSGIGNTK